MIGGLGPGRHAAAPRPQLRVCYLCGQQFGSASIGIHVPQCYAKKLAQWEVGDIATRGSKPKHPDTVNWKGTGKSVKQLNDEQYREFDANLVPCPHCGRTFLPDRLPVHLRGCNGGGGASGARPATRGSSVSVKGGTTGSSSSGGRTASRGSSVGRRPAGMPLVLPTCYLCGQQFGTASIAIHVPQCYAKKRAQWEAADPAVRGRAPRHPDGVNWNPSKIGAVGADGVAVGGRGIGGGSGGGFSQEQADAQFQEFVSSLEPCPNCGRKFVADRLVVHLRSCRPGHTAKPVPPPTTKSNGNGEGEGLSPRPPLQAAGLTGRPSPRPAAAANGKAPSPPSAHTQNEETGAAATEGEAERLAEELDRVNPIRNRVPKASSAIVGTGRACPHCEAVEHDANAKYCRECGWNLNSRHLAEPCRQCGEAVPEGSRFCGTCGEPVNGAAADERAAGGENVNAPTVRVLMCPACQAVCDADGNFCDNCGAALGGAEPEPGLAVGAAPPVRYLYCAACNETTDDLRAVYCEECGEKLQVMERVSASDGLAAAEASSSGAGAGAGPGRPVDTLRPNSGRGSIVERARTSPSPSRSAKGRNTRVGDDVLSGTSPSARFHAPAGPASEGEGESMELVECATCGRRFAAEVLERHHRVCSKQQKKRPTFNMTKQRLADCDGVLPSSTVAAGPGGRSGSRGRKQASGADAVALPQPKKNWRTESEAFRAALRDARRADAIVKSGGNLRDLPPPTYSENAHYVPCPHCKRRFAPDVAERHIPRCANTVNRPKPPPKRR